MFAQRSELLSGHVDGRGQVVSLAGLGCFVGASHVADVILLGDM